MWVYKNNAEIEHAERTEKDFVSFFNYANGRPVEWGVLGLTMDKRANRAAFETMRPKDWVVCFQVDLHAIIGLAKVDGVIKGRSGLELHLRPHTQFAQPINVPKLRKTDPQFAKIKALAPGSYAALQPVSKQEEPVLRAACGLTLPVRSRPLTGSLSSGTRTQASRTMV